MLNANFNPQKQYRCTIIRGKAKTELDDLLPAYAEIIVSLCPCEKKKFDQAFDAKLQTYLGNTTAKTLANHRTEIAGKLFGMWSKDVNNIIIPSPRTIRLIENQDNPAFFKDIIARFQFPNGMDKIQTIQDRVNHKISIRPVSFLLRVMVLAELKGFFLSNDEAAYYILNCLEVLQGVIAPELVVDTIIRSRQQNITNKVEWPGKEPSYNMQHINELISLIELANLIEQGRSSAGTFLKLKAKEKKNIEYLAAGASTPPEFDLFCYNLSEPDDQKKLFYEWQHYFCYSDIQFPMFSTTQDQLVQEDDVLSLSSRNDAPFVLGASQIGEEGEMIVLKREQDRVRAFNQRLVNKVIYLGKQRGFGYDISSIHGIHGPKAEEAIYIEVKTTKRVTKPQLPIKDQFYLTRNEWVAASQHRSNYFIYRVYLTTQGVYVLIINDPVTKKEQNILYAEPVKYHVEFDDGAGKLELWEE